MARNDLSRIRTVYGQVSTPDRTPMPRPGLGQSSQYYWYRRPAGNRGRWLAILGAVAVAVLGAGAVLGIFLAGGSPTAKGNGAKPAAPTSAVVTKLTTIGRYQAASESFSLSYPYVVHRSFWFFTGETFNVRTVGTDTASVRFASAEVVRNGPAAVTVTLPQPTYGQPSINVNRTTLTETSGLLTHMDNLISNHPQDANEAEAAAYQKISAAAASSPLLANARAKATSFLTGLLQRLGFKTIKVIFV
jgi:hypothetical protein